MPVRTQESLQKLFQESRLRQQKKQQKLQQEEEHDYRLFIKTAHRKFGEALGRNPKVRSTANNGKKTSNTDPRYRNRLARRSYCYEYIGEKIEGFEDILLPISVMRSKKMFK